MLKNKILLVLLPLMLASCGNESSVTEVTTDEETRLIERALEIHDRVLTVDTHADTPIRMIEPGFDLAVRHDPRVTGSKLDYPRMKEGGLDSVFFAAFVAQDIRNGDGNQRAKDLVLQMINAVIESTEVNSDIVGLALDPMDAYELETLGKRAIYLGIENGYPIGESIENVESSLIRVSDT